MLRRARGTIGGKCEQTILAIAAEALLDEFDGGGGHFTRLAAHDLHAQRVIVGPAGDIVVQVAQVGLVEAAAASQERAVEQGLGHAHRAAVTPRHQPHGRVGVTREPGLEEGRVKAGNDGGDARIDAPLADGGGHGGGIDLARPGRDGG
jgi:hypothetical protein